MAKKSKSMKSILVSILTFLFAGGIFGMLALPFVKIESSSIVHSYSKGYSAYSLLDFENNAGTSAVILVLMIFAGLLALTAIAKMVVDSSRNRKAGKIINAILIFFGLAVLAVSIAAMIYIPSQCNAGSFGSLASGGTYAGWLGLSLTLVDAFLAFATSLFSLKK